MLNREAVTLGAKSLNKPSSSEGKARVQVKLHHVLLPVLSLYKGRR